RLGLGVTTRDHEPRHDRRTGRCPADDAAASCNCVEFSFSGSADIGCGDAILTAAGKPYCRGSAQGCEEVCLISGLARTRVKDYGRGRTPRLPVGEHLIWVSLVRIVAGSRDNNEMCVLSTG